MTRTEAIAVINAKLAALDDQRLQTVADIVDGIANDSGTVRQLTPQDLALIEQSKEDFRQGRTLNAHEYHADMAAFLADLKARYAAKR